MATCPKHKIGDINCPECREALAQFCKKNNIALVSEFDDIDTVRRA